MVELKDERKLICWPSIAIKKKELKTDNNSAEFSSLVNVLKTTITNSKKPSQTPSSFKGYWMKAVRNVATELKSAAITAYVDNWYLVEEELAKALSTPTVVSPARATSTTTTVPTSRLFLRPTSTANKSSKSNLGYLLNAAEKEEIEKMSSTLDRSKMWKLSCSRRLVEGRKCP